jgi:hypothetical protein
MSEQTWKPISWRAIGPTARLGAKTPIHLARPGGLMNDWATACGRAVPGDYDATLYWSPADGKPCLVCARIVGTPPIVSKP